MRATLCAPAAGLVTHVPAMGLAKMGTVSVTTTGLTMDPQNVPKRVRSRPVATFVLGTGFVGCMAIPLPVSVREDGGATTALSSALEWPPRGNHALVMELVLLTTRTACRPQCANALENLLALHVTQSALAMARSAPGMVPAKLRVEMLRVHVKAIFSNGRVPGAIALI